MTDTATTVEAEPTKTGRSVGIATIANDKVINWLLPFLESHAATSPGVPLYVIPYDDNLRETRRAVAAYGASLAEIESGELDRLATRLYPLFPKHRRRLRKFLSLALPLDEVVYIDVDTLLLRDFGPLFGLLDAADFIVACETTEYVYNRNRAKYPFLAEKPLFNDGFFVTSRRRLELAHFFEVIANDEAMFHEVRQRGMLFAQPLTNFVVHRRGLRIASLADRVKGASGESFYKAEGVTRDAVGFLDRHGLDIYFAHWAGAVALPKRRIFDAQWLDYARVATQRVYRRSTPTAA